MCQSRDPYIGAERQGSHWRALLLLLVLATTGSVTAAASESTLFSRPPEIEPAILSLPLFSGDLLLLCSDGLITTVSDEQILAAVNSEVDLGGLADRLVSEANDGGGPDNITVALVRVLAVDSETDDSCVSATDPDGATLPVEIRTVPGETD